MPAGAEYDRNSLARQVIVGAQHVIVALNLVVDVMNSGSTPRRQRDGMMDGVDAHQRDISDPVADARVANLGPELFVPCRIGRTEADMAETGYSRISRRKVTLAAAFRPDRQFDLIAGRILESDKRLHLAQDALGWPAGMYRMA